MGEVCPPTTRTALFGVFDALSSQRTTSPRPETVFKTTASVGTEVHFAPGWHFGEAQGMFSRESFRVALRR
jgi:hypothetical protein